MRSIGSFKIGYNSTVLSRQHLWQQLPTGYCVLPFRFGEIIAFHLMYLDDCIRPFDGFPVNGFVQQNRFEDNSFFA